MTIHLTSAALLPPIQHGPGFVQRLAAMAAPPMGGPEPVELADARAHRNARIIAERHRADVLAERSACLRTN